MAALMTDADLAIGAGGSTNWERCCLGLPGVVVETAENQARSIAAMVDAGTALATGLQSTPGFADRLLGAVGQMRNARFRTERARQAASICEGDGVELVVDILGEKQWK
jgi:spore coat polysaccharide biosynthesis predicted glycosyltransferase SpsG